MRSADDLTYGSYLRLDDLLGCQSPLTDSHDELLFVIIHQVYELWFKQILHEAALLQSRLEAGNGAAALHTARRIAKILKTIVGQLDVLETMTPQQFASFRPELGSSSGFQSNQFRYLEAVLGRRDFSRSPSSTRSWPGSRPGARVFDSLLRYLQATGWPVPAAALDRDPAQPWPAATRQVQALLATSTPTTGAAAEVCEALVDIDEGIQEWRYRHVKMVERIIGAQDGHRRLGRLGVPALHAVPPRVPRPVGDPLPALSAAGAAGAGSAPRLRAPTERHGWDTNRRQLPCTALPTARATP